MDSSSPLSAAAAAATHGLRIRKASPVRNRSAMADEDDPTAIEDDADDAAFVWLQAAVQEILAAQPENTRDAGTCALLRA